MGFFVYLDLKASQTLRHILKVEPEREEEMQAVNLDIGCSFLVIPEFLLILFS